jgi:hypothetical protein
MMTARKMQQHIGRLVFFEAAPGLVVLCIVRDVRVAFGRVDVEIEPAKGSGSTWVQAPSVKLLSDDEARKEIA